MLTNNSGKVTYFIFLTFFIIGTALPVGASAQSSNSPDITPKLEGILEDLARRYKKGDCAYIDQFIDKYLGKAGPNSVAASMFAIPSLIRSSSPKYNRTSRKCRYHNRKRALEFLISLYESSAGLRRSQAKTNLSQISLQLVFGKSWLKILARHGVRPAMQHLAVLNFVCTRKAEPTRQKFWTWIQSDPETQTSDPYFSSILSQMPKWFSCSKFSETPDIATGCRWLEIERIRSKRSSRVIWDSIMLRFTSEIGVLPRFRSVIATIPKFLKQENLQSTDNRAVLHFHNLYRNRLSDACAASLSEETWKITKNYAAQPNLPSRSLLLKLID